MAYDIIHNDCRKFYLRQIYGTLPILLYHMANLTDYLIKKFDVFGGNGNDKWSTYIAIMAWTKISKKDNMLFLNIGHNGYFICNNCNKKFNYYNYDKKQLQQIFYKQCYIFEPSSLCKECF